MLLNAKSPGQILPLPVAIANGGSGQITAQLAINALSDVAGATNEYVLTKDTATGNAIFKAATGGGGSTLPVVDETAIVYKTGIPANTLTFDVTAYTAPQVVTWPDAAMTVAGLEVANVFKLQNTFQAGLLSYRNGITTSFIAGGGGNATGTGISNVAIGNNSFIAFTTAEQCVGIGENTLQKCTTGSRNVAIGNSALKNLTTGTDNFAMGASALLTCITGQFNVAIGRNALLVATSSNNVSIGDSSLKTLVGSGYNIAIGANSGRLATGANNIYIGESAGYNNVGSGSVIIGYQAGYNEANSNKLYIANSNTANPLIYGEFDTGLLKCHTADAGTNTAPNTVSLVHLSSGTPVAGFGVSLRFGLESSTTENQDAARIVALWNVATHASRVADLVAYANDSAGEVEIWRGRAGAAPLIGFLGATPIARPSAYTLAATAGRVMPTPEGAFTGQDNAQAGTVYAKSADLITLQTRLDSVEGVLRQLIIDLASTSGYGLLVAA